MTINAPAMWLLALYVAVAEEQGARPSRQLAGTTQNDIVKEYLSRGTYVFPPGAEHAADHRHDRLVGHQRSRSGTRSTSAATTCRRPGRRRRRSWPTRCRTAIAVLDSVRDSGQVPRRGVRRGRRAHLVLRQRRAALRRGDVQDAGLRPALGRDHARALRRRRTPKQRRLRYGVQVNSLGPDRGAAGEQRPAHRAGDARGDAVPGRPRPRRPAARLERGARACRGRGTSSGRCGCSRCSPTRPTCWSTRTCSRASRVVEAKVAELVEGARAEIDRVQEMGGAVAAVESGYMKGELVALAGRAAAADGVGRATSSSGSTGSTTTEPSPLQADGRRRDRDGRPGDRGAPPSRRSGRGGPARDAAAVEAALDELRDAAEDRRRT